MKCKICNKDMTLTYDEVWACCCGTSKLTYQHNSLTMVERRWWRCCVGVDKYTYYVQVDPIRNVYHVATFRSDDSHNPFSEQLIIAYTKSGYLNVASSDALDNEIHILSDSQSSITFLPY